MVFKISTLVLSMFLTSQAFSKTCDVNVEGNDQMKFNVSEIVIGKDCTQVKLTLKHVGKLPKTAMGHNIVIAKKSEMATVNADATKAGPTKDYTPSSDKVLVKTKLIGGGESDTVTFDAKKLTAVKDELAFFCTFPGHSALMNGKVVIK